MPEKLKYRRHGPVRVSVVRWDRVLGKLLGHLSIKGEDSWALRDFIANRILRSGFSDLRASEIEAELDAQLEPRLFCSVTNKEKWRRELETLSRSEKYFGDTFD